MAYYHKPQYQLVQTVKQIHNSSQHSHETGTCFKGNPEYKNLLRPMSYLNHSRYRSGMIKKTQHRLSVYVGKTLTEPDKQILFHSDTNMDD